MIRWEAWCYRCRGRDSGTVADESRADEAIADFRTDHFASCGPSASIGHVKSSLPLTGDGAPEASRDEA